MKISGFFSSLSQGVYPALVGAGTTQATGTALKVGLNEFTTVASASGATLPSADYSGFDFIVVNFGANALLVYPPVGGQIDRLGVNAPISIAANGNKHIRALSSTQFYSR